HGDPARAADPRERVAERRPAVRDETRLALGEVALEDLLDVAARAPLDDVAGEVHATDHRRVADVLQRAGIGVGDADVRQLVADLPRPLVAPAAGARQAVAQLAVRRV